MKELIVYAIQPTDREGRKENDEMSNADFIKRAQREDTVFSLQDFQNKINAGKFDCNEWFIRILDNKSYEKIANPTHDMIVEIALPLLEEAIEQVFIDVHAQMPTKNGDIAPEQVHELDGYQESIADLIARQVLQNIEDEG